MLRSRPPAGSRGLVRRRADAESYLRENLDSLVLLECSLLSTADFASANYDCLETKDIHALRELAYTSYSVFPPP